MSSRAGRGVAWRPTRRRRGLRARRRERRRESGGRRGSNAPASPRTLIACDYVVSTTSTTRGGATVRGVTRIFVAVLFAAATVAAPVGGAAATSPSVRLTIVHFVTGCHVWQLGDKTLGASAKITLERGTRLESRPNCPMDFDWSR